MKVILFYIECKVPSKVIFFFRVLIGYQEEVLAQKRILKDRQEEKSLELKTFKTLQYNITCISLTYK